MSKRCARNTQVLGNKRTKMAASNNDIDEDLHSRQLAVYGRDSFRRIAAASVLILGAKGLGLEVAKNVILAGVKALTVHDQEVAELRDLGSQFYLTESDVGRNRALACRDRLQELNTAVAVTAACGPLDEAFLSQFQVVVATNTSLAEAVRLDHSCRSRGSAFIKADIRGVFGQVFTDFGPAFAVLDVDGEEPVRGIVAGITQGPRTLVTCVEDERLEFQDGQSVIFSEVQGMVELNNGIPRRVSECKAHSFVLEEDTTSYLPYSSGGLVVQHKDCKTLAFKPLQDAISDPGSFLLSDFAKLERSALLHTGFQALDAFQVASGRLPAPGSEEDAGTVCTLAAQFSGAVEGLGAEAQNIVSKLSYGAAGDLNPMAAIFGGIVGQEVVKAVTGKFHPIFQWFYYDCVEALPANLGAEEFAPMGSRHDGQIGVFGKTIQNQLSISHVFLVGAGALGCEFLKNFAMMGMSAAGSGQTTVTDDDNIEKSNLSRQFLFRDWDIGCSKSEVAGAAAKRLNQSFNVKVFQERVSPATESVFDPAFWEGLDFVVNALDNINARLYVDARCVYFQKALFESGASRDPPEKQAPMCTLHSFPHNIDHCLTFARSEFEGLLERGPSEVNLFLEDPKRYVATIRHATDAAAREKLQVVADLLVRERCNTFEQCIAWIRKRFQHDFHDRIAQLVHTFPADAATSSGASFWSAPKRFPQVLTFNPDDDTHAAFVQAGAILKAQTYNLAIPDWGYDRAQVAQVAAAVSVADFIPATGFKIETDPKAVSVEPTPLADEESVVEDLITKLEGAVQQLPAGYRMAPVVFEKDDDANFHMELIAGLANMRARNYRIEEVDKFRAKIIAGKIIPAIATTTAMATGLVCLEIFKLLQKKDLEAYRNTFANLALPLFAMAEPVAAKRFKFKDLVWTLWDRWILEGDLTVQQVLDWFKARHLEAYSISCGQSLLYSNIFPKHRDRISKKITELFCEVAKQEIQDSQNYIDVVVACEDEEGEDLDVPLVSIKFR